MPPILVWLFLTLSVVFTAVHNFAVTTSLYWYYSWFDIVMHLWGGALVSLGIVAFAKITSLSVRPGLGMIMPVLCLVMVAWEVFEYSISLYNPDTIISDVLRDVFFGFSGGLISYFLLRYFKILA